MSLTLYFHPLSSFCQKVLVALYESDTPFAPHLVDLGDADAAAAFKALWPVGRFPVLRDDARGRLVPESSVIIEYLARHYPGGASLVPADPDAARVMRAKDRFFDLYVQVPMQQVVLDRTLPEAERRPRAVAAARAMLETAYGLIERDMAERTWAMGERFTMADCAAAPALSYAHRVAPIGAPHPHTRRYLERLKTRPSFARAERESEPWLHMFPG